jgi:hypothetical protein
MNFEQLTLLHLQGRFTKNANFVDNFRKNVENEQMLSKIKYLIITVKNSTRLGMKFRSRISE